MIHLGRNTTSRIISKGISAGKSENTYRGLVSVHRKASGRAQLHELRQLLIGHDCGAHTVPYIESKNASAVVEHEATTSKISEDQLFYCLQRGLSAEEATALIVNGFVKDVLQQLPMEFAVEAQKLISISWRGAWADAADTAALARTRHGSPSQRASRSMRIQRHARANAALPPADIRRGRMLEIRNLTVQIEDKRILNGLTLTVNTGEVAAIMGPNGSGKSTLSYVLAGKEDYEVLDGEVLLNGENLLDMEPHERAAAGVFLAFQYPLEIPGVATMTFLKAALNAQRKSRAKANSRRRS